MEDSVMTVWAVMVWIVGISAAIAVGILLIGIAFFVIRGVFAAIPKKSEDRDG